MSKNEPREIWVEFGRGPWENDKECYKRYTHNQKFEALSNTEVIHFIEHQVLISLQSKFDQMEKDYDEVCETVEHLRQLGVKKAKKFDRLLVESERLATAMYIAQHYIRENHHESVCKIKLTACSCGREKPYEILDKWLAFKKEMGIGNQAL